MDGGRRPRGLVLAGDENRIALHSRRCGPSAVLLDTLHTRIRPAELEALLASRAPRRSAKEPNGRRRKESQPGFYFFLFSMMVFERLGYGAAWARGYVKKRRRPGGGVPRSPAEPRASSAKCQKDQWGYTSIWGTAAHLLVEDGPRGDLCPDEDDEKPADARDDDSPKLQKQGCQKPSLGRKGVAAAPLSPRTRS